MRDEVRARARSMVTQMELSEEPHEPRHKDRGSHFFKRGRHRLDWPSRFVSWNKI